MTVSIYTDEGDGSVKLECSKQAFAVFSADASTATVMVRLFNGAMYRLHQDADKSFYTFKFRASSPVCTVETIQPILLSVLAL